MLGRGIRAVGTWLGVCGLLVTSCSGRPDEGSHSSEEVVEQATPPAPREVPPVPSAVSPFLHTVEDRTVAPGVRYRCLAGTSPRFKHPLVAHVLSFDPRDPRYRVAVLPALGKSRSGRQSTRRLARHAGAVAAINGSYFHFVVKKLDGDPIGLVLSRGRLLNPARGDRPALGILADGRVLFGRPAPAEAPSGEHQLAWQAGLASPVLPHVPDDPAFGHRPALARLAMAGTTAGILEHSGARDLPAPWNQVTDALEGGPQLIHRGRAVPLEGFNWTILHGKEPRTAVGLTGSGQMLWITVDGRRPGHSMGTSLDELTRLFLSLGAVEALNWDGGGSTTMVLPGGNVVTKIATGWVREVSNALVLLPATASILVAGLSEGEPAGRRQLPGVQDAAFRTGR